MNRKLDVYLLDMKAGELLQDDGGALAFTYTPDYLTNTRARAISVSMPLREAPYADRTAQAYFSGLLPDERARRRLAKSLGISESNSFGLLEVIGGECAGALTLMPAGEPISTVLKQSPEPLSASHLVNVLALLRSRPLLGGMLGVRLSLAGAQDKLAVCVVDGHVALATNGQPTTHILKPHIEGLAGTVENEIFCMRLAKRVGLSAPEVSKGSVGNVNYYLIERYDRTRDFEGSISRLHQEDFCQTLGIAPQLKYEDEGGPGVHQSLDLLRSHTRAPGAENLAFLRMLVFHFLIGNADAHGKNYALLYRENVPDLAPVYDAICTAVYPSMAKRLAMRIGGRNRPDTVHLKHWLTLVSDTAPAQRLLKQEMQKMASKVFDASTDLAAELREEGIDHPIIGKIQNVINKRAEQMTTALAQSA
jgi:serine/threonine-protein kinase HipA